MTKKEMVRAIAELTGQTQAVVREIVQKTFDSILETLEKGERVELRNFGVFDVKLRAERKARNISTGEQVVIPERYTVTFKPSKEMEKRVARCDQDQRFAESGFNPNALLDGVKKPNEDDSRSDSSRQASNVKYEDDTDPPV